MKSKTLAITGLIGGALVVLVVIFAVLLYRPAISISKVMSAELSSPEFAGGKLLYVENSSVIKSFDPVSGVVEEIPGEGQVYRADFSPDGEKAVIYRIVESEDGDIETEPWVYDLGSGSKVKLLFDVRGELIWIGSKLYLSYFDESLANGAVREVDPVSGAQTGDSKSYGFVGPSIVSNGSGSKLLIQELHPSGVLRGLYLVDPVTGEKEQISENADIVRFAFLSETLVLFLDDTEGLRRLVEYDLSSKRSRVLGFAADPDKVRARGGDYVALIAEGGLISEDSPILTAHKVAYFKGSKESASAVSSETIDGAILLFETDRELYLAASSGVYRVKLPLLTL